MNQNKSIFEQWSGLSAQDRKGIEIAGFAISFLFTLAALAVYLSGDRPDPETLCLKNLQAHTVILIDQSDALNKTQQRYVENMVQDFKKRLTRFEKFSIYILSEKDYVAPTPVFSKCYPGSGDEANPVYQNPAKVQKKFQEFFQTPLQRELDRLLEPKTSETSPIMEMLREISYKDDFSSSVPLRRLLVVSDLVQNVPMYSQYKDPIDFEYFQKLNYSGEVKAELSGVQVTLAYIMRGDPETGLQQNSHTNFWMQYFATLGAQVALVQKIR